jgi:hypothetical protein
MDCTGIALSAESGTDTVTLELKGGAGEQIRARLLPAHLSSLHQQIHAVIMARNPAPGAKPAPAGDGGR